MSVVDLEDQQFPKIRKHPPAWKSIETGYQVMEVLREKGEPLPDWLLMRFLSFGDDRLADWLAKDELSDQDVLDFYELRRTIPNALEKLDLLERSEYPIPKAVAAQVCRCNRTSLFRYDRRLLKKLRELCNDKLKEASFEKI